MQAPATRHELLLGLEILDEAGYQRYRDVMTPLLESRGGRFRVDLREAETLQGPPGISFDRLFVISFPDAATKDAFFSDPAYLAARDAG